MFVDAASLFVHPLHVTKLRYLERYQRDYGVFDWSACAYFPNHLLIKRIRYSGKQIRNCTKREKQPEKLENVRCEQCPKFFFSPNNVKRSILKGLLCGMIGSHGVLLLLGTSATVLTVLTRITCFYLSAAHNHHHRVVVASYA